MQLVLPPISTVSGPGAGMLPRTPQNEISMLPPRGRQTYLRSPRGVNVSDIPPAPRPAPPDVIVVLGCRVHRGDLRGAVARRVTLAAELFLASPTAVLASGGRRWDGETES